MVAVVVAEVEEEEEEEEEPLHSVYTMLPALRMAEAQESLRAAMEANQLRVMREAVKRAMADQTMRAGSRRDIVE